MKIRYVDMYEHDEDCRIRQIGLSVMQAPGQIIGVLTDDEPGKPERYIAKVQEWFPKVALVDQAKGPVAGVVTLRFTRKLD